MSSSSEALVVEHYAHGTLERSILGALLAAGKDLDHLDPVELSSMDEFHIGGREATAHLTLLLGLAPGAYVLDVGCGIGGPSRYVAGELHCRVAGIDLTEEFVQVAASLSRRAGMGGSVSYRCASALNIPFEGAAFDGAYMIHVGMNIHDKAALFREIRRVLKAGASFGIYDVMREREGELSFPLPWAGNAETSFVESRDTYRRWLEDAGFRVEVENNRREYAIEFFTQMRERIAANGGKAPVLGINVIMGADWPQKISNLTANLQHGFVGPVEMVARAR